MYKQLICSHALARASSLSLSLGGWISLFSFVCLFVCVAVLADPRETNNVAKGNPSIVAMMATELAKHQNPIVFEMDLTPDNLACYNCSFVPDIKWFNYTGPPCIIPE